jgi:hypothetical protein
LVGILLGELRSWPGVARRTASLHDHLNRTKPTSTFKNTFLWYVIPFLDGLCPILTLCARVVIFIRPVRGPVRSFLTFATVRLAVTGRPSLPRRSRRVPLLTLPLAHSLLPLGVAGQPSPVLGALSRDFHLSRHLRAALPVRPPAQAPPLSPAPTVSIPSRRLPRRLRFRTPSHAVPPAAALFRAFHALSHLVGHLLLPLSPLGFPARILIAASCRTSSATSTPISARPSKSSSATTATPTNTSLPAVSDVSGRTTPGRSCTKPTLSAPSPISSSTRASTPRGPRLTSSVRSSPRGPTPILSHRIRSMKRRRPPLLPKPSVVASPALLLAILLSSRARPRSVSSTRSSSTRGRTRRSSSSRRPTVLTRAVSRSPPVCSVPLASA